MRDLRFRAWDLIENKFVYFNIGDCFNLMNTDAILSREGDDWIIQQFTGFVDAKGKGIWEGDILRQKKKEGAIFEIAWSPDGYWWAEEQSGTSFGSGFRFLWQWAKVTQVIGNIYESPELLDKTP